MDAEQLIEKLLQVERLFAGAATDGEREAAANAAERIRGRLEELEHDDEPQEYKFCLQHIWSRRLLLALLRRYGIRPYRYSGQRRTTVMVRASRRFIEETLWPEFQQFDQMLHTYLSEMTEQVIREALEADSSEAEVRAALPGKG